MSENAINATILKRKLRRTPLGLKHYRQGRVIIKALALGNSMGGACKMAGIDAATLWRWRQRKINFDRLLNCIIESRIMVVEDALFKKAGEGSVAAQIFFLCNRASKNWHNVADIKNIIYNMPSAGKDGKEEPVDRFKEAPRVVFAD